jgi:hypothetical protein
MMMSSLEFVRPLNLVLVYFKQALSHKNEESRRLIGRTVGSCEFIRHVYLVNQVYIYAR